MLSVESFGSPNGSATSSIPPERLQGVNAPWFHKRNSPNASANESPKEDCREALLRLMSKRSGVSPAAQRMALDMLMKLSLREGGDKLLFSRIMETLVKERAAVLLGYLLEKYFIRGDIRSHAADIIGELEGIAKDITAHGANTQKPALDFFAPVTHFLEQQQSYSLETADSRYSSNTIINTVDRNSPSKEESEQQEHKANVSLELQLEEPDKQTCGEDFSMVISTAARVRDSDANNSVKSAPRRKGEENDDEGNDDEDEEQDEEQDGSGEDEDEPEQGGGGGGSGGGGGGGNDEEEEEEEEEEDNQVEEEEGEDEDDGEPQRTILLNNTTNTNTNTTNNNVTGGEFDEEDDENDGRVEDEDEDEGDEDEDPDVEDDEDTAPPKKKIKK